MRKFTVGNITCYNEDYRDVLPLFDAKHFTLATPDPNYGIGAAKMAFTRDTNRPCKQKNGSKLIVPKKAYLQKDWDDEAPDYSFYTDIERISDNQIIWGVDFFDWADKIGSGRIKWNKGFSEKMSFKSFERAYCSMIDHEREVDILWAGFQQAKSLNEPMVSQGNKRKNEKRIHPTQKPTLLYKRLFIDYLPDGGLVIDTHGGSFSSAISAMDMGIEMVIIEKDKDHFKDGLDRLTQHYKTQKQMLQFAV